MVRNDIPRDIPVRDPPHTYALRENRSSFQSLALIRGGPTESKGHKYYDHVPMQA